MQETSKGHDPRVAALHAYGLLDTPRTPAFDDLAMLAKAVCGTRFAVINLVDSDRQWFKAEIGFGVRELPLDDSICAKIMLETGLVEIPDLMLDDRFSCNPLITAGPGLRFYAGASLQNDEGHVLGTLCVLDTVPMQLTDAQREALAALGRQTMAQMELWRAGRDSEQRAQALAQALQARDRADAERAKVEAAHAFVIERVLAGLVVHDAAGTVVLANETASRLLGLSREQLQGRAPVDPAWHFLHEDGRAMEVSDYPISIVGRTLAPLLDYVVGVVHAGRSEPAWALVNAYPELDANGALMRTVVSLVDISERKRVEEELRTITRTAVHNAEAAETERRRLNALLDATPVGIAYANTAGRLVDLNTTLRDIWGDHPLSTCMDMSVEWKGWWAAGTPRAGERVERDEWPMARALTGEDVRGVMVEIEPFGQPGVRKTLLVHASPVRDAAGRLAGAVSVQQDISDRVRADAELRESEARFRALADNIPQLAWMADRDGTCLWYNDRWYEFTGTTWERMQDTGWRDVHHPDHFEQVIGKFRDHVERAEPWEDTFPLRARDGDYQWFLSRAVPIRDEHGAVVRWFGSNTNISAQRAAENALREGSARKDEFLAMLAHELRNPLAPISTAAQLLRMSAADEGRVRHVADILSRQVGHLTSLVDDLLDVSRVTRGLVTLTREPVDLETVVASAVEQVRPLLQAREHALTLRVGQRPLVVEGDQNRLVQVLSNLLNNAAKYTPPGGRLELDVDVLQDRAVIRVTDNGDGMDAQLIPRVFDLFSQAERTPDRSQGGLGIGLALVRSLVELHAGSVTAASAGPQQGSTFTVTLPVSKRTALPAAAAGPRRSAPDRGSVLIVDDNADAADTLAEVVRMAGHRVTVASSAAAALVQLQDGAGWQVVILDIGLPDMDGYQLASRLRNALGASNTPTFVALTGYGQPDDRRQSQAAGFDHHLVKPADIPELLAILGSAVEPDVSSALC